MTTAEQPSEQEHPATPTLDKIMAVQEDSQVIQSFIEWVFAQKVFFAKYPMLREMYPDSKEAQEGSNDTSEIAYPITLDLDSLLHQYFGIDKNEEEKERMALLEYVRANIKEGSIEPLDPKKTV